MGAAARFAWWPLFIRSADSDLLYHSSSALIPSARNVVVISIYTYKKNQLHAVSRTQQGRQREPSVEILR